MRLKRHLNSRTIFFTLYYVAFAIYIIVGLQPAKATNYDVSVSLSIPSIGLDSDVTSLTLENRKLETPDTIVGSYSRADNKTLLIGHSTTVFTKLNQVELGDEIMYDGKTYVVNDIYVTPKEEIVMEDLLKKSDVDTIVVMTCAGELLGGGEATHRLIVTASVR